ncbi:regulatory factor X-associated protein isoform X1 [Phascolarctos cinereus]
MQPCGGQEEAAGAILRPTPASAASATPTPIPTPTPTPRSGSAAGNLTPLGEVAGDGEDEAAEDEADLLDTSDPPGGGESTASPEELEDEETHSGGEGGRASAGRGGGGSVSKTCTYEGCRETTSQVAKQRKPWMCKKHRNKMYKDKYKKKKSDQALSLAGTAAAAGGSAGSVKLEVPLPSPSPGRRGAGAGRWGAETRRRTAPSRLRAVATIDVCKRKHRWLNIRWKTKKWFYWRSSFKTYSLRASVKSKTAGIIKKSRSCTVSAETATATKSTSFGAKTTTTVSWSISVKGLIEVIHGLVSHCTG